MAALRIEIADPELHSLAYDPDFTVPPELVAVRRDLCKALQLIDASVDLHDLESYRSIQFVASIDGDDWELGIAEGVHLVLRVKQRGSQPVVVVDRIELHSKEVTR